MPLKIGDQIASGKSGPLKVRKLLGQGTQGQVFLVQGENLEKPRAVKWYFPGQATDEQRRNIQYLAKTGPPKIHAGRRFIWPLDVVTAPGRRAFGYLMPLVDAARYAALREIWSGEKPPPTRAVMCEVSYQLANSYRALHLSGHCYRDISDGNVMFNPQTGDTLICDNDNVSVNRRTSTQVWGTWEYLAPEVARREAKPSAETDLHSLAVLLFRFWMWHHHPLHGTLEYNQPCWDDFARLEVYGKNPVFIFDPANTANALPDDPAYYGAKKMWRLCPKPLRGMFARAFTGGLASPPLRVTEGEWQNLFLDLLDKLIPCPKCRGENFWDGSQSAVICWNCLEKIRVPPKLAFHLKSGPRALLLVNEAKIRRRHLEPFNLEEEAQDVVGRLIRHPENPDIWGLRNQSRSPWKAQFSNGLAKEYPPDSSVPLAIGDRLEMNAVPVEILP